MEYYDVLGVEKNASVDEIKRAYKKKAMEHHPDRNKDPKSEEIFKKLTEAYTVLSDDQKRSHYDQFGNMDDIGGPGNADMQDILRNMFGGMGGGGPFASMFGNMFGGGRTETNVIHCEITLDEVYSGTSKKIDYEITNTCQTCNGCGAQDPKDVIKCMQCNGQGSIMQRLGPMFMTQTTCPACFGNGTSIKNNKRCGNCKGNKEASYKKSFTMEVPKGIPDNFQHKISGKGHFNKGTNSFNDLVVLFHYTGHNDNVSADEQGNVKIKVDIKLEELMCGFSKKISPYGHDFYLTSTGYFNPTNHVVFKNKGLPVFKKSDRFGDLIFSFNVVYGDNEKAAMRKYIDVFLKIFKKEQVEPEKTCGEVLLIS